MSPRFRHRFLHSNAGLLPAAVLFFSLATVSAVGGNGLLALCLLPAGLVLDFTRADAARSGGLPVQEDTRDA